jgi:glucose/mannose-6-phosphate isomerase
MYVYRLASILDDLERIKSIDGDGMRNHLGRLPEFCEDAIERADKLEIPSLVKISGDLSIQYTRPKKIIVAGMGGSAIGGSILKEWLRETLPIPIEVPRSYTLPAYADKDTLVFAVSYSGNTEETLSCFLEALERRCMIIATTSGGMLQEYCQGIGIPLVRLPGGYPPRSALPYLLLPLATSLRKLGVPLSLDEEVKEAITVLREVGEEVKPDTPVSKNQAKGLALGLEGYIPLIIGSGFYKSVALRMKTQFNESSKTPAKTEVFPELNHNMMVGWTERRDLTGKFSVILLRDQQEPTEIRERIEATRSLVLDEGAARVLEIWSRGRGRLARVLSTLYVGDYASFYLAILYGVDPTPIPVIEELKRRLKKTGKKRKLLQKFKKLTTG